MITNKYWTVSDERDYDMWEVRMVDHVFRSCGCLPRWNFTLICGAWCDVCRNDNYAYSLHVARSTHTLCCILLYFVFVLYCFRLYETCTLMMAIAYGGSTLLLSPFSLIPLLFSRYRSLSPLSRKVLICVTCEILYYKGRRRDTSAT
jgi:hypothetical protein